MLEKAFGQVLSTMSAKFCFFIDGLDEYNGDGMGIIKVVQHLAQYPRVKICVSSCPWTTFETYFRSFHYMLVMEDMTYNDIEGYVQYMLSGNPALQKLAVLDPWCHKLAADVASLVNGVWL